MLFNNRDCERFLGITYFVFQYSGEFGELQVESVTVNVDEKENRLMTSNQTENIVEIRKVSMIFER